jgi:Domain of unknown function (DUF4412)
MLFLAMAALLLVPGADVCFEQTTVIGAGGRPNGSGVATRVCHSGARMRLEAAGNPGGPAFVLRLDEGRAFRLDPEHRRATLIDPDRLRAQVRTDLSMARDLMGLSLARPRTTPLSRELTIAGYRCHGYRIAAGETIFELYVTEELPLGVERFADLLEWTGATAAMGGILEQIRALPGFPLETRSRVSVMGEIQETRTTVTKVTVGPVSSRSFEIPAGWDVVKEETEDR